MFNNKRIECLLILLILTSCVSSHKTRIIDTKNLQTFGGSNQSSKLSAVQKDCGEGDSSSCDLARLIVKNSSGLLNLSEVQRACDRGNLISCLNLGMMYETGVAGPNGSVAARKAYRQACKLGARISCDSLVLRLYPQLNS